MNTWPDGQRRALSQSDHEQWNARVYPGTRQICERCGQPTERCEDDSLYSGEDCEDGPLCYACYQESNIRLDGSHINPIDVLQALAKVAHAGGLENLSEHEALNRIRKLTLPYWDRKGR